ncbi:MAG: response regulator transcription factor [Armatimonadetes bacterium]|nr:response regulator transcription factor [Armatimonadota bacterium]
MASRVVIVEDQSIVRDGLCALLENSRDFEVVGVAGDGRSAVRLISELRPDIVLMDICMPDLNGIEATRQLVSDQPSAKVCILSVQSDRNVVAEALRAGASGYVLKDCAFAELSHALSVVAAGKVYVSPDVMGGVVEGYLRETPKEPDDAFALLSAREREVLQLLAEGHTNKTASEALHLSVKTVEAHRANIMRKVGANTLADLIKFAIRSGVTSLDS